MLPTNLTSNEVKNAGGTEIEFSRSSGAGANSAIFIAPGSAPAFPHQINIDHQFVGEGVNRRRRSRIRVSQSRMGEVDATRRTSTVANVTIDIPVGNIESYDGVKNVLANLISFLASTGADTTVKFDCSGTGAAALVNGTL